jgi:hypothetical protein
MAERVNAAQAKLESLSANPPPLPVVSVTAENIGEVVGEKLMSLPAWIVYRGVGDFFGVFGAFPRDLLAALTASPAPGQAGVWIAKNGMLHQSLCVGRPDGAFRRVDLRPDGLSVTNDKTCEKGAYAVRFLPLAGDELEVAELLLDILARANAHKGYGAVSYNCRTFAREGFREIVHQVQNVRQQRRAGLYET